MELYILRHAIAADREDWQGPDDKRPLTRDGIAKMKQAAAGIVALVPKLELIFTSPLVRAHETAEIVYRAYRFSEKKSLRTLPSLAPSGDFARLCEELQEFQDKRVMLVGHQPHLGDLISFLITNGPLRNVPMKKGGLAYLQLRSMELPRPAAALQWLLTPKQLRLIGGVE